MFSDLPIGETEVDLFFKFLDSQDFSGNTRRAITQDMKKFAKWFVEANKEKFALGRVTTRDITDFKRHLREEKQLAVATVNRCLVSLRRFFGWLVDHDHLGINPTVPVKELHQQQLPPKGLERAEVRRLLRELELRNDIRATAIFSLMLYTGCRVGDVVSLELGDVLIGERSGSVVFRFGKGNKQRSVPLPIPARKAIQDYLETRPPVESPNVFVGERGVLTDRGIRSLCDKYAVICGFKIHPHLLRHTFAHQFLADNQNDLVGLAQILGHENLNTTRRYVGKTAEQLLSASENVTY